MRKLAPIILGFCIIALAIIFSFGQTKYRVKTANGTTKMEPLTVRFNVKSLPEHNVYLISPYDSSVNKNTSGKVNPYSVILRNSNSHHIVGYSITWQCFDGKNESPRTDLSHDRQFSNSFGYAFMYGEESERRAILNNADELIQPNSTWLISPDFPAHKIDGVIKEVNTENEQAVFAVQAAACPIMTVILDGVFFDDGTFIGPDMNGSFAKLKTQMDVRYEVLQGVQRELKSGKNPSDVFRELEQIRDRGVQQSGAGMSLDELRTRYQRLFAQDVLGMKDMWGTEGAIANVQRQLSRPWVTLRKL